ncbi:ATP-binding protein [Kribbella catacumbae]|uniref:ATP-binding protein n=1 Tax=Kribbella catacumbae TaxID=460086 RepID=UPI00036FDDFD|nr:ATP-binding protein [Kribbella catacumbae]
MSNLPPITTHEWTHAPDAAHIAAIRADPARYSRGGLAHLVLEVVAYPVDEAEAGTTNRVLVTLHGDGSISVEDNGRGTNVFFDENGKPIMATRDIRFFDNPEAELLPDGLPRSGMSVVAALSSWLIHENRRLDGAWTRRYEHGLPESALTEVAAGPHTGTVVHFHPDPEVFGDQSLSPEDLRPHLDRYLTEAILEIRVD